MIPPALDADGWATGLYVSDDITLVQHRAGVAGNARIDIVVNRYPLDAVTDFAALIALANAALPDDDLRKVTWAMVDEIREAERLGPCSIEHIADALASYLAPRDA